jgi:hypothetical protein
MELMDRGLNLAIADVMTPEEEADFRSQYTENKGHMLPAFEYWLNLRPDVLKRYRMQARQSPTAEMLTMPFVLLAFLHYYCIQGFEEGILYEIRHAHRIGATRDEILDTVAISFIHGGPKGMQSVAVESLEYMRAYEDLPDTRLEWPAGWAPDPDAFSAGLDYSSPDLLPGELELIEAWFDRYSGEIPEYVSFLGKYRPGLLKAQRSRFEHAVRACPKQYMPYLMIHFNVTRGFAPGIREGVLLGKGFGMRKVEVLDAICWGMMYGGQAAISIAHSVVSDILDAWV